MDTEVQGARRYLNPLFYLQKVFERGPLECVDIAAHRAVVSVLRALRVQHLRFNASTIGHLAVEPDCYLKEGILGLRPAVRGFALMPHGERVGNEQLLEYWRPYLRIIRNPRLCRIIEWALRGGALEYDVNQYAAWRNHGVEAPCYAVRYPEIQQAWGDRPPLLTLTHADRERGWSALRALGMPEGSWFVGFHCREAGFHQKWDTHNLQRVYMDYRNVQIESYLPAMEAVIERGGWCVRLGDPSMRPLSPMKNVIDYVHTEFKSEWMDLFLAAEARTVIATASGPSCLPPIFGKPVGVSNQIPMGVLPYGTRDACIHKLLRWRSTGKLVTFAEVLGSGMASFVNTQQHEAAGVEILDNSPDEIRDLVLEMLEIAEGRAEYTERDRELQQRFKALMRPEHYAYGATSREGRAFLRKYADLLPAYGKAN